MGPDSDEHERLRSMDDHGHDRGVQRGNVDGLQPQRRLSADHGHTLIRIRTTPDDGGAFAIWATALLQRDQVGTKPLE